VCHLVHGYLTSVEYPPHSLVYLEDIGYTDNTGCCRNRDNPIPNGGGKGDWIFPDSSTVGSMSTTLNKIFSRNRNARALLLHRGPTATGPTGIYTCMIPDRSGTVRALYFGIYSRQGCKYYNCFKNSLIEYCLMNNSFFLIVLTVFNTKIILNRIPCVADMYIIRMYICVL